MMCNLNKIFYTLKRLQGDNFIMENYLLLITKELIGSLANEIHSSHPA